MMLLKLLLEELKECWILIKPAPQKRRRSGRHTTSRWEDHEVTSDTLKKNQPHLRDDENRDQLRAQRLTTGHANSGSDVQEHAQKNIHNDHQGRRSQSIHSPVHSRTNIEVQPRFPPAHQTSDEDQGTSTPEKTKPAEINSYQRSSSDRHGDNLVGVADSKAATTTLATGDFHSTRANKLDETGKTGEHPAVLQNRTAECREALEHLLGEREEITEAMLVTSTGEVLVNQGAHREQVIRAVTPVLTLLELARRADDTLDLGGLEALQLRGAVHVIMLSLAEHAATLALWVDRQAPQGVINFEARKVAERIGALLAK
ncbi:MAG: hypothetical protein ONB48_18060 [candidate division KSB1 bacterium]|nr:hypothetical protein [candidate division KSB1 bacterium]MDZ7275797.1 hypothetical protein [candidate division KSB1 bacterium]MDZ7287549.1 hypothetical protein [candidate division KSB1 bacterium]MDZ7308047.1 hypothetical protein [candidate division KSB1 bacterium]MDZ7350527.1 hypothetical protein [candidate division KSB1 bacterium]